ncbi:hypothetical protein AQUCO_00500273v1 [Aquilegia coerulea]|uniref:Cytochrome P450 n=1 Tax=Aquilegia coerulea TaxID=218851 RepID=A0A2G5ERD8_AQUCA|nr:hypothetical protein AQUCO_00500273v1 [Aquilegia coerulea]
MELQQLKTFPFILSFILILLVLVRQRKKSKSTHSRLPLPPGPLKLPLIGHLHHMLGGQPHHKLKDLAKIYGPIMYLKLGEVSTVVISSPGVAEQILKTHDLKFFDRQQNLVLKVVTYGHNDVIMAPYGNYWRQLRKICVLEILSAKKVQSFWSLMEEEVSKLVRRISLVAGSQINLSEKIFTLTNDITARATFGKTCKDKEAFLSVTDDIASLAAGTSIADLYPSLKFLETVSGIKSKVKIIHQKVDKILDDIIREHKEIRIENQNIEGEEDLVDVLLRIQEGQELELPITLENVKAIIFDMFIAGTDTSSTVLEWTFIELLRNPRVMAKAQAEVRRIFNGKKKIDQADMGKMNYLRECWERCEIEGYEIPKGCRVVVNAWAMGRDPENWKNPESFEPERFQDLSVDYKGTNFKYIPFGAGRRMCPGILFGITNVELPLALLLYHFDWKLANGVKTEELDMSEHLSLVVRRKQKLYVIPMPYYP